MNSCNILSLGNIIKTITKVANNKNATQNEIFCTLFDVNDINTTTINNYCIGIRAIGIEYKKIFEDKYNKKELLKTILSIISILDDKIYIQDNNSLELINKNLKLEEVIKELNIIIENDNYIEDKTAFNLENNYLTFIEILKYAILTNKQPIYIQNINVKLNKNDLNDYMEVKLYWGQSYISSLIELARKGNVYAYAELGALEFEGNITGKPNYKASYDYYIKAANKDHPKACWMIANMILTKKVNKDYETMWKYLNKSIELGSAAGYNTLGLCYKNGIYVEKDIEKAIYNFNIAGDLGYVFAYNNLGKLYEETNFEESIKYYKISADMNNSWALNKVGEYYRKNNDLIKAYLYYSKAIECPIQERSYYAYYNLAEYYYKEGFKDLNIKKDDKKYTEYMKLFNEKN